MPAPRIPPGGTRGTAFRDVGRWRWEDATTLLDEGRFNGAIYLAGYAIECHLKFAVCKRKGLTYLPAEFEVHDWDNLVDAAGLENDVKSEVKIATIYSTLADAWGPALRYRTRAFPSTEATRLYKAMEKLYLFLNQAVR